MVEDMSLTDLEQGQVTCCPDIVPDLAPMNPNGLARSVLGLGWTGLSAERPVVLAGTLIIGDTRLGKYRPTARNPVRAFVI